MKTFVNTAVFCALSAFLSLAPAARANTLTFTLDSGGSCCGTGATYGTITLAQNGINDVLVTETLFSGIGLVNTSAGDSLDFSINGHPAISIFNLTSGFAAVSTTKASPYGPFQYGIDCTTACGTGGNSPYTGTLSFDVVATGLTPESFIASNGYYFASDIKDSNLTGKPTGNVAASSFTIGNSNSVPVAPDVPEPASLFLTGAGLIAFGLLRKPRFLTSRSAQAK